MSKGEMRMNKKYDQRIYMLLAVMGLALFALPALVLGKPAPIGKVAVVNGTFITQEEFDREVGGVRQQIASRGKRLNDVELQTMKKDVLENMINTELLYQESKKQGIKVDEAAINEQWKVLKGRFPTEEELKRALTMLNLTEAELKSQIEQVLAIQQLVDNKVAGKIIISSDEIKAYYDSRPEAFRQPGEVMASHILIKVDAKADASKKAEARKKIENIQKKLKEGGDFAALAKEFSEGPSGVKGGDLGYFKRGQMVKPFEDAAFALKPGEVSDIVETRFGYHLIKVIDKKPEKVIAFADVKDKLQLYIKRQKIQGQVNQYIEELKGKAKIERFLNETAK